MVTLSDIAARAGVSTFTVSCALRGHGRVAPATGERILAMAREMGYIPSAAAKSLAEGRLRSKRRVAEPVIAMVRFNENERNEREEKDNRRMIIAARAQGYDLKIVRFNDFPSPARMSQVLWAQGVAGLILMTSSAPADFGMERFEGMEWDRFSVVRISRGIDELRCHTIRSSAFSETIHALNRIIDAGYRRIGVIMLTRSASAEDDYGRLGALRAFEDLRRDSFDWMGILRYEQSSPEMVPNSVRKWLAENSPDVILCFPVVWRVWLEMAGYSMPKDFAFVGLPVQTAEYAVTGIATTGTLQDSFGREFPAALQMLHEELTAGRRGIPLQPYEHVLPVVWQDGVTMPIKNTR